MVASKVFVSHVMMVNEKAALGDEALPPYSVHDVDAQHVAQGPTWKRWLRKRFWIPTSVLVLLVVFGAIFGAMMGVKASKSSESISREHLFASQSWNSSTRWNSYSATPTYHYSSRSYSPTPPAYSASTTYGWYPYPSPSPSSSPDSSILQPQKVPRDISLAAVSPDNLVFWDLRADSTLWKKEGSTGSWTTIRDRKFLVAPVSVRTSASSHIAVSVDASSGRIVYQLFREGKWDDWQELDFSARFARRPAVVSRAESKVDIVSITDAGRVWVVSYDGSQWSSWTDLGHDITSEVSATSWGPDRLDVFGKRGKTVMHRFWTASSGWAQDWEDLGNPWQSYSTDNDLSSAPLAVSWQDEGAQTGVIDVFMTRQGSEHKTLRNNMWSDWTIMYASHEGYEFPDTQSLVKGDGVDGRPFAHLVSRGTSNCIHYNVHNGTNWGFWDYLWCYEGSRTTDYPTQFMPTYLVNAGDGKVELVARDSEDNYIKLRIPGDGKEDLEWPGPRELWENLGQPA